MVKFCVFFLIQKPNKTNMSENKLKFAYIVIHSHGNEFEHIVSPYSSACETENEAIMSLQHHPKFYDFLEEWFPFFETEYFKEMHKKLRKNKRDEEKDDEDDEDDEDDGNWDIGEYDIKLFSWENYFKEFGFFKTREEFYKRFPKDWDEFGHEIFTNADLVIGDITITNKLKRAIDFEDKTDTSKKIKV